MADVKMTVFQKLKSITSPILFNILLPTFDVFSDARIILLLFTLGGIKCRKAYDEYNKCSRDGPTSYCTSPNTFPGICEDTGDGFRCRAAEYLSCHRNPTSYCTSPAAFPGVCLKTGDGCFSKLWARFVQVQIRPDSKGYSVMYPPVIQLEHESGLNLILGK